MTISKLCVATLFISAMITSGCATSEFQTSTAPISQATASQIIDGKDTKTDIIAMFGAPNGLNGQSVYSGGGAGVGYAGYMNASYYSAIPGQGNNQNSDDLLTYKNCTVKTAAELDAMKTAAASAASVVTFGLSSLAFGGGMKNSTVEECKMLAVLLDDNDIVRAHGYVDTNIFSPDRVNQIVQGKSTKADIVRTMTVPNSITDAGDDEILTYKNCLSQGTSGWSTLKNTDVQKSLCQQASFIINKSTGLVDRVTHIPFPVQQ